MLFAGEDLLRFVEARLAVPLRRRRHHRTRIRPSCFLPIVALLAVAQNYRHNILNGGGILFAMEESFKRVHCPKDRQEIPPFFANDVAKQQQKNDGCAIVVLFSLPRQNHAGAK